MNQIKFVNKIEGVQDLFGDLLEAGDVEVVLLFDFTVVFGVLIQIVSKKLSHNNQMFFMVEIIDHFQQVLFIKIVTIRDDKPQKFDFVNGLVEVVLVVFNDFHAYHLLCVNVVALDCF